jgi:hypothetical protein
MNVKTVSRALLILLLSYFTWILLTQKQPWIPLDAANLLFHEGGHLIFLPFGQFAHMIGGSLLQILLPIIFLTYFMLRKELFSVTVMLFWLADNLINVSIYMKDAKLMQLPLLIEGTIHDWNWIFNQLGLLDYATVIGGLFFYSGALIAIISVGAMTILTLGDAQQE